MPSKSISSNLEKYSEYRLLMLMISFNLVCSSVIWNYCLRETGMSYAACVVGITGMMGMIAGLTHSINAARICLFGYLMLTMKYIALEVFYYQHAAEYSENVVITVIIMGLLIVTFDCVLIAKICIFIDLCHVYHANLHQDDNQDMYYPLLSPTHKFVMGNVYNDTNTIEGNLLLV